MSDQFDFTNKDAIELRGYCGIGCIDPKFSENVDSLVRSARCFSADFVFSTSDAPLKSPTVGHHKHIPVFDHVDVLDVTPDNSELVAIEYTNDSTELSHFKHPERAVYVLGRENTGVPSELLSEVDHTIHFESQWCENMATSGAIVLRDRFEQLSSQ